MTLVSVDGLFIILLWLAHLWRRKGEINVFIFEYDLE